MRIQNVLLTLLGVFGFSIGGGAASSYPAQAAVQQCNGLTEEECCQLALEKNSIEALEEFLRLYPRSDTACGALATTARSQLGRESHDNPNEGGVYGN